VAPRERQNRSFLTHRPGAGGYVHSGNLHDWDVKDALRILPRCADAASESARVLVVDRIADALGGPPDAEGDLRMLRYARGRERTLDQLGELVESAGLEVSSVVLACSRSIIELRPSH